MSVGYGFRGDGIKAKGRPLQVMAHLKRSLIQLKAETNCVAHALIIVFAKITNEPNYNSYQRGCKYTS
jgi:hypothetical protein